MEVICSSEADPGFEIEVLPAFWVAVVIHNLKQS